MPAKHLRTPGWAAKNWNDAGPAPPKPMLCSTSGWPPWFVRSEVGRAGSGWKVRGAASDAKISGGGGGGGGGGGRAWLWWGGGAGAPRMLVTESTRGVA